MADTEYNQINNSENQGYRMESSLHYNGCSTYRGNCIWSHVLQQAQ
jgi:hypothetical protein